jgi:hypothetical protein
MFETEVGFLSCDGPLDAAVSGCPRGFMVDVENRKNWPMLDQLHLDHRYDLKVEGCPPSCSHSVGPGD